MNFGHLRTFVMIVDAGGIHRAASRLHLSQPAVSRQIQALEGDLGVPLFDRIGRRVQLTSEGEDLLWRSRRLLAEADSFIERAGALKKGDAGIFRIGATPQVIESTLAHFLDRFRDDPLVEVHLIEEGGSNLAGRLAQGHILLALIAVDDERFNYRLLYPTYGLAVFPKTHTFARRRTLMSQSSQTSRSCCFAAVLHRAIGLMRRATSPTSGRGFCWKVPPPHRDRAGGFELWNRDRTVNG